MSNNTSVVRVFTQRIFERVNARNNGICTGELLRIFSIRDMDVPLPECVWMFRSVHRNFSTSILTEGFQYPPHDRAFVYACGGIRFAVSPLRHVLAYANQRDICTFACPLPSNFEVRDAVWDRDEATSRDVDLLLYNVRDRGCDGCEFVKFPDDPSDTRYKPSCIVQVYAL